MIEQIKGSFQNLNVPGKKEKKREKKKKKRRQLFNQIKRLMDVPNQSDKRSE